MGNGAGGESIYNGKKFKDERAGLMMKHDRELLLSMGNSGKNSNSSQFFVTFGPAPQLMESTSSSEKLYLEEM